MSGCFGAQLPVGQEIFREFPDSDMPIVARSFALKPPPCFQQQSRRVSFGLPADPKHMHFLHSVGPCRKGSCTLLYFFEVFLSVSPFSAFSEDTFFASFLRNLDCLQSRSGS
jgi:hypothetical protein